MKKIIFLLLLICLTATADNKLHQLQNRIQNLTSSLHSAQNQQTELQQQLQKIETKSGTLTVQLQKTQTQLTQEEAKLHLLNNQQYLNQSQLTQQREALADQIRTVYMGGQEPYLKILLNEEDPTQMSRIMTYFHYINQRRLALITAYNQSLTKLSASKQITQQQTKQLQLLQQKLQNEQTQLERNKIQRQQLLLTLNHQIQNKNQQLNTLIANKIALEKVLNQLAKQHTVNNAPLAINHSGKLPWPTHGRIVEHFGASIQQSQLKTNGVLIAAPEGQNVYAVAPGKVVYASWMAGYGLLLIVDHGNGLMSIYGRNNSLYKKKGDSVKTGDLIATVGTTGGYTQPALYFALRQSGQAVDPNRWCA